MVGYSKLFSEIVTSSIWSEDDKTRIVWITILALKDKDGFVPAALPGLANAARVTVEECDVAVTKLEAPDKYSRSTDHEGRRIEKVEGGWTVLNHKKYRAKTLSMDKDNILARDRMRRFRDKNKTVTDGVTVSVTPVSVSVLSDSSLKGDYKGGIMDNPDFQVAWTKWQIHRIELKHKLTPSTAESQLKKLEVMGVDKAIKCIEHSIFNGWQGLFEQDMKENKPQLQRPITPNALKQRIEILEQQLGSARNHGRQNEIVKLQADLKNTKQRFLDATK